MDKLILLAILIALFFLWLWIQRNGTQVRSKEEKQAQIKKSYIRYLDEKLTPFKNDKDALIAQKTKILKEFAKELNQNLFFDEEEARSLLQELASYEPN
jgi:hypothetical protein